MLDKPVAVSRQTKMQNHTLATLLVLSVAAVMAMMVVAAPASLPAHAQEYSDGSPTLSVSLQSETPFVYKDSEGYTVVVGLVQNDNPLTSVTNIKIQVNFYDRFGSHPVEVVGGTTSLRVLSPDGISPYSIRSATPNPAITDVSISLLGFDSSPSKQKELEVSLTDITVDANLHLSGTLENGAAPISDTNVYLATYDAFDPPRILSVENVSIGSVEPDGMVPFEFDGKIDSRAAGLLMVAESDIFYSDVVRVKIPAPQILTKMVTISDVSVKNTLDGDGGSSTLTVGSPANIRSTTTIQFAADQDESDRTAYTYYVQIKGSGKNPVVEHIDQHSGVFVGSGEIFQNITWIPQKPGLYFLETFVWDRDNVPLSDPGPTVLFVVN